jgi:Hemerythrin HHE cation binding domain
VVQTPQAAETRGADGARHHANATLVPVAVDTVVDPASMLVALHGRIERQFALYEQAEGGQPQQFQAAQAIGNALASHVALEDELLYPALQAHTAHHDPEIEQQLEQDHLLDEIMVELDGMVPADGRFDAKVRVLMEVFREHARDSEALLLSQAATWTRRQRPTLSSGQFRHHRALHPPGRPRSHDRRVHWASNHVPRCGLWGTGRPRADRHRHQRWRGVLRFRAHPAPMLAFVGLATFDLSVPPAERLTIQGLHASRWQGFLTIAGMVGVITAVLAGSAAGLLASVVAGHSLVAALVAGALVAATVLAGLMGYQRSAWKQASATPLFDHVMSSAATQHGRGC